jgi:hypothetical protein
MWILSFFEFFPNYKLSQPLKSHFFSLQEISSIWQMTKVGPNKKFLSHFCPIMFNHFIRCENFNKHNELNADAMVWNSLFVKDMLSNSY